jgi:biotin transport system substrate-specific component
MSKPGAETLERAHTSPWWIQGALVVSATFFIALCARVTVPLPFTPVPLTLQNFAVLLVGLVLGSAGGFAALVLYLAEGMLGLPVFNPTGPGGLAQLLGPTGGYLMAYPMVAFISGWIFERGGKTFRRAALAALAGEAALFAGGLSWLALVVRGSWVQAAHFGLYPFVFAEVAKIMAAAGLATRLPGVRRLRASRST